jgi:sulfite reductase (NADPH) flavoprotein alpha-component
MSNIHTPLPQFDEALLRQLSAELAPTQQIWLSGYLYGLSQQQAQPVPAAAVQAVPVVAAPPAKPGLTILYGSHTGNGKSVAKKAAEQARAHGFEAMLKDMNDYTPQQLKNERLLLLIVSTHGEGEPPAAAETLHRFLYSARAQQLPELRYAVLALGDRSYAQFCQTGREFDEKLSQLGARRLLDRVECDVDFHEDADRWIAAVLGKITAENGVPAAASAAVAPTASVADAPASASQYNRKNPFLAPVLEKTSLNGRGSARDTWHLELSLEGSGLTFEPGDSLGVWPQNPRELVLEVLKATILPARERVDWDGQKTTLAEVLTHHVELSLITRDVLEKLFARTRYPKLAALLKDAKALREYTWGRDLADLLREFPDIWSADTLLRVLRRLQPRLYSIASGPSFAEGEAHLTVSAVRYETNGRKKRGAASTHLADGLKAGQPARVFIERNEYFKLPQKPDTPILMIGPGTGVAPFRAFVQEREATGAKGKSWLFFGNPHFETDFLYQTEWLQALKKGTLSRLDVAFSRDQGEKIYVQHKLRQNGREVFDWLENGAHVYVCGDKNRMAADVQEAFRQIIAEHGGRTAEQAEEYLAALKQQRRYLEDVY